MAGGGQFRWRGRGGGKDTDMETVLLDGVRFEPDFDWLLQALHLRPESAHAARVRELAREAQSVARPKALYGVAYIEDRGDDFVIADGVRLTSRVLRVNLEGVHRVFPYVATCGRELDEWSSSLSDLLESFWADAIKEHALRQVISALNSDLAERYQPGPTSAMNPGSLADWPMPEQRPLFALLGDVRRAIGVELKDSFLMVPVKSVSGLRFPNTTSFENCQLCRREGCPGRRAPYDLELYARKYRRAEG